MGLLEADELDSLRDIPQPAQVVWVWLTQIFKKLIWEKKKIPPALVKNCHDQLFGKIL